MKRLGILLAATAACILLPSASFAVCTTTGTIPTISITTSAEINVRANTPGANMVRYATTNANYIAAALAAEASHMHVTIIGNAQSCTQQPSGVAGLQIGGIMTKITVSP